MNTANSTDLKDYYLDKLFGIINEIVSISAGGDYIYRGEPRCYPKISSTLYRSYESAFDSGQFTIEQIQEIETQKVKDYIRNQDKPDFEIASELQHYGGESNLIDFTRDYHIALYFACAKLHGKDGRIVLLQQNQETIAKYQIERAQYPPKRAQAQNSIFVQPPGGFIYPNDKDVKTVCIPKEIKQWILIHLHKFQDISYQTLFNDMYGFLGQAALRTSKDAAQQGLALEGVLAKHLPVENLTDKERQERHERTVKAHITRIEYSPYEATYHEELARYYREIREYDCSIETSSKAILLKPDYTAAYVSRGAAYAGKEDLALAIEDLVKAKRLGPPSSPTYILLGLIYDRLGDCPLADEHFQQAHKLNPNNPVVRQYLQQRDRKDITMSQNSEKAEYLLNQAAADPERKVEYFDLEQGIIILTNGKDIIKEYMHRRNMPKDRRETVEAEWASAFRELVSAGYLEQSGQEEPLTLFRVTDAGYQFVSQSNSAS